MEIVEVIKVIALLCQVGVGSDGTYRADFRQHYCQQEYIKCFQKKEQKKKVTEDSYGKILTECVLERKI